MMQGRLIVLEGIDGSGKSTQFKLLTERLKGEGLSFNPLTFPRYSEDSSALIRAYLSGEFGTDPSCVNAYAASTFFFVDRYASYKSDWGEYYKNGGLILSDRYTTSNAIHQGAKLSELDLGIFLDWLYDFEFRLMELPKPDAVIYMDIDLETSLRHIQSRQSRTNTAGDIHETHRDYLENCIRTGRIAAARHGWNVVNCLKDGHMREIGDIGEEIYDIVMRVLR